MFVNITKNNVRLHKMIVKAKAPKPSFSSLQISKLHKVTNGLVQQLNVDLRKFNGVSSLSFISCWIVTGLSLNQAYYLRLVMQFVYNALKSLYFGVQNITTL